MIKDSSFNTVYSHLRLCGYSEFLISYRSTSPDFEASQGDLLPINIVQQRISPFMVIHSNPQAASQGTTSPREQL